jgi:hypothetical protein
LENELKGLLIKEDVHILDMEKLENELAGIFKFWLKRYSKSEITEMLLWLVLVTKMELAEVKVTVEKLKKTSNNGEIYSKSLAFYTICL